MKEEAGEGAKGVFFCWTLQCPSIGEQEKQSLAGALVEEHDRRGSN